MINCLRIKFSFAYYFKRAQSEWLNLNQTRWQNQKKKILHVRPGFCLFTSWITLSAFLVSTARSQIHTGRLLFCVLEYSTRICVRHVCMCFQINVLCAVWKTVCAVAWYFGRTTRESPRTKFPDLYFRLWDYIVAWRTNVLLDVCCVFLCLLRGTLAVIVYAHATRRERSRVSRVFKHTHTRKNDNSMRGGCACDNFISLSGARTFNRATRRPPALALKKQTLGIVQHGLMNSMRVTQNRPQQRWQNKHARTPLISLRLAKHITRTYYLNTLGQTTWLSK